MLKEEIRNRQNNPNEMETVEYLKKYEKFEGTIEKIVIHGVHRFEPMIIRLIRDLENLGIEIIFLINYIPEFEKIYETWRKVYLWTNIDFTFGKGYLIQPKGNLGEAIGMLLEGQIIKYSLDNVKCVKFHNITSFCDYISNIYIEAVEQLKKEGKKETIKSQRINKMKEQFYAVDNRLSNNILKQYHPEQFGNRHFLAYPIGQFILSMYNMWDDEKEEIIIDSSAFKECLSTGFFQQNGKPNPIETYRKLEDYLEYQNIGKDFTLKDFKIKINYLINNIKKVERKEKEYKKKSLLRRFSIYNMDIEELKYFEQILDSIDFIVKQLFQGGNGKFNFKEHFEKLLDILTRKKINNTYVSEEEKIVLEEIKDRLKNIENKNLSGSIDDIRDSLHFYLNRIEETNDDESNWIVRNFEQLDGGVLLGKNTRTKRVYHIALVSDNYMNGSMGNRLPWPLDEEFFSINNFKCNDYKIFIDSYKEYRNFLRYSLFYSTYYLDNEICISYVENSEGEKNSIYFILDMLGLNPRNFDEDRDQIFRTREYNKDSIHVTLPINVNLTLDEARNYEFCNYRYILEELLDRGTTYESEYLQKLFYGIVLYNQSLKKLENKDINEIEGEVINTRDLLKEFIELKEIDYIDIQNKIINRLKQNNIDYRTKKLKKIDDRKYIEIIKKFIYAEITEDYSDKSPNLIGKLHYIKENQLPNYINKVYSLVNNSDPIIRAKNKKMCEFCGQNGLCLHGYREV